MLSCACSSSDPVAGACWLCGSQVFTLFVQQREGTAGGWLNRQLGFWNWPLLYSCHFCCFLGMAAFPTQPQVRRCAKEKQVTFRLHKMRKEVWKGESDQISQAIKILWLIPFVGEESHSYMDWLTNSFAERIIKCKYFWITVYVVILFPKQALLCTVPPVCCELKDFPAFIPFRAISFR